MTTQVPYERCQICGAAFEYETVSVRHEGTHVIFILAELRQKPHVCSLDSIDTNFRKTMIEVK